MSKNEPFKLAVMSTVQDYTIQETTDWLLALESLLAPGDAVMIDGTIYHDRMVQVDDLVRVSKAFLCSPMSGPGGHVKTLTHVGTLLVEFLKRGLSRHNRLFVIGGGSLMDLGGFAASVYMRGIKWVYFPTTLLAQADSCMGGKTSINLGEHKNIIGTFWPPEGVLIDRAFLRTLPYLEQLSGVGEILHFFMVDGEGWYKWANDNLAILTSPLPSSDQYIEGEPPECDPYPTLVEAARATLQIKREFVMLDERDQGIRRLLNFGHTFAHGIEAVDPSVPHGLAVARGIEIACEISRAKGFLDPDVCEEMTAAAWQVYHGAMGGFHIKKPFAVTKALIADKKRSGEPNAINVILTSGPGQMFETTLRPTEIAEYLGG